MRNRPPFRYGEIVICDLNYLTVRPGDKVRVVECSQSAECESGWLVTGSKQTKGKLATRPTIAIEGVDSGWFRKRQSHE